MFAKKINKERSYVIIKNKNKKMFLGFVRLLDLFLVGFLVMSFLPVKPFSVGAIGTEILYEYTITGETTRQQVMEAWPSNDNRTGLLHGIMDGEITKYYFGWANAYKSDNYPTGINKNEELEININDLDISMSSYEDIRLKLDYIQATRDKEKVDIFQHDTLRFYIVVKDATNVVREYGPFLFSEVYPTGVYERDDGIDFNYDLISESLKISEIPDGSVIQQIKIKPYDLRLNGSGGGFKLGGINISGYRNSTYKSPVDRKPFDKDATVEKIIDRMYDLATVKWVSPENIYGNVYSDTPEDSTYYYEKGETYYGIPYGKLVKTSLERFAFFLDEDNNYLGSIESSDFSTLDCGSSIFEASNVYIPFHFPVNSPRTFIWNRNVTRLLGDLKYPENTQEIDTDLLRNDYSEQEIYEAYAELEKGDILGIYHNPQSQGERSSNHVSLITGETKVVRKSNGDIDPDNSYVVVTDNGIGSVSPHGEVLFDDVSWTPDSALTDLTSISDMSGKKTNWGINKKRTFKRLYTGSNNHMFVPIRYLQFDQNQDTIEKPYAELINANTIDDIGEGLKGTLVSNYKITKVEYRFAYGNNVSETFTEYPVQTYNRSAHNVYSLYLEAAPEIRGIIKNYSFDDDASFAIVATVGGEELEVLRIEAEKEEDDKEDEDEGEDKNKEKDDAGDNVETDESDGDIRVPNTGLGKKEGYSEANGLPLLSVGFITIRIIWLIVSKMRLKKRTRF